VILHAEGERSPGIDDQEDPLCGRHQGWILGLMTGRFPGPTDHSRL
jgi:hypothetical protein